jgi:hypothetical protein
MGGTKSLTGKGGTFATLLRILRLGQDDEHCCAVDEEEEKEKEKEKEKGVARRVREGGGLSTSCSRPKSRL